MLKPPVIANIALFSYIPVFLILLKVRSVKLSKNWFVPIVAIYFGLVVATLFALFLNGADSTLSAKDSFFSVLVDVLNPKNKRGKVLFGGYFGLILGLFLADFFTKQKKFSDFLDISAISTSLLFSIWRLGCFAGGCCYGQPSETFGVSFSNKTIAYTHLKNTALVINNATVPLLPTQLLSFAGDFAIFLFLLILFCRNKTKYPYFYFFAHAFLYGLGRFTVEFFRIDPREFWGVLSMSQWISLVLIAAGTIFFIKNRKEIAESFRKND
ncbi:prolipoprotein diacylglyceryl transferase [bacterium]|nr:prolipoprotein diacylglyceryl transferase [bacterium]